MRPISSCSGRAVEHHGGVRFEPKAMPSSPSSRRPAPRCGGDRRATLPCRASWPDDAQVRVRMGLHSGEAHLAGDDYGGFEVNRAARIAAAGHGGQIVMSEATRLLVRARHSTAGCRVRDLGRHVLRDVPAPERLFQLDIPGLQATFPPLRTSQPTSGQPANAAHQLPGPSIRSRRAGDPLRGQSAGDAHRPGWDRQDQSGHRARSSVAGSSARWRLVRRPRRDR